ncbi:MAG: Rap1a/Tai family immunity protein [Candidatus Sulfotelmatobacter sp.]
MKTILALLMVIVAACCFASAQGDTTIPKTAAYHKQQCEAYIGQQRSSTADICIAYTRGMKDSMDGDLAWMDDTHKRVVVGTWADGVTVDQLIRVFVKFANDNPAMLNQSAVSVFRRSVEATNLYTYASPQ